jgi:hypothetical protein
VSTRGLPRLPVRSPDEVAERDALERERERRRRPLKNASDAERKSILRAELAIARMWLGRSGQPSTLLQAQTRLAMLIGFCEGRWPDEDWRAFCLVVSFRRRRRTPR